jgi:hypothetical protein
MRIGLENAAEIEEAYAKYPGVKAFINSLIEDLLEAREEIARLKKRERAEA